MEHIIQIKNLTKTFKDATVLNIDSLNFEKGKIHGIIGRNGSGKTVLLECICGVLPPSSGTVSIEGKIVGKEVEIPVNIGIIIESPAFLDNYSGYKNLCLLSMLNRKATQDRIKECLAMVGLDWKNKKKVGKYSMGMRQRLGIAQAIMDSPHILILDEPMNGLDQSGVDDIRKLLCKQREEGVTILLASHYKDDVELLCDNVYEMENGMIRQIR